MPDNESAGTAILHILENVLATLVAAEDELGRLDAAAGDGDHGRGMVRGFRAAVTAAASEPGPAGEVLTRAGTAFGDAAGGASGALLGSALTVIGQTLPADDELDAPAVGRALQAGLLMIERLGKAKPGDRTMVDTLAPFVQAFTDAAGAGESITGAWAIALPSAERGMQSTVDMIGRRGRAARLGERGRGHLDAGARSTYLILETVRDALAG